MKGQHLIALFVLSMAGWLALAQSAVEVKLMASAQKALPQISTNDIARAIGHGLWNSNRTAVAIAIPKPKASLLFVFLRQLHGDYLAVDVSGMEGANVGRLGPDRHYDRLETAPLKWLHRGDELFEIQVRTRAWSSGLRYTTSGTLAIKPDGTCLWQ